jgi:DNA-binding NarL/FixJ family response regulator
MAQPAAHDIARETESQKCCIECVFLTCFNSDFQVFAVLLRRSGIHMYCAETLEKADFLMTMTDATVLLSDSAFVDGNWYEAAAMLASFHPKATLVVVADDNDSEFRTKALNRGVCQLLSKPLRMSNLRESIQTAHRISQNRSNGRP